MDGKKVLKYAVIVVAFIVVIYGVNYLFSVKKYKESVNNIQIQEVNLSQIDDGTYTGEYDVDFIYAKVNVTVKNHVITNVDLVEYKHEKGAAAEAIPDKIVEEQRVDVDCVSGATNSSKVIKKAVENALTKK